MSYQLFLDDFRYPVDCTYYMRPRIGSNVALYGRDFWVIARSFEEFVSVVGERGMPTLVSFDHDLDASHYEAYHAGTDWMAYYNNPQNPKTGFHCAKWLIEKARAANLPFPHYFVHSMNGIGIENINRVVRESRITVIGNPFSTNP